MARPLNAQQLAGRAFRSVVMIHKSLCDSWQMVGKSRSSPQGTVRRDLKITIWEGIDDLLCPPTPGLLIPNANNY